jgi:hypothetical protein
MKHFLFHAQYSGIILIKNKFTTNKTAMAIKVLIIEDDVTLNDMYSMKFEID